MYNFLEKFIVLPVFFFFIFSKKNTLFLHSLQIFFFLTLFFSINVVWIMENHSNYKIEIWISTHLSTFEPEFRNLLSTFEPEFRNLLSTPRLSQKKGVLIKKKVCTFNWLNAGRRRWLISSCNCHYTRNKNRKYFFRNLFRMFLIGTLVSLPNT